VVVDGQHEVETADCASSCPTSFAAAVPINVSALSEGSHAVQVIAVGANGAEAAIERTLIIDRTPPSAPTHVEAATQDDDHVALSWTRGEDPVLPDGTSGSAVDSEVRTQDAGGEWSAWTRTTDDQLVVGAAAAVEVRTRDAAGNVSEPASRPAAHRNSGVGSCAIPQPSGAGGPFIINFEDCDDLDGDDGEFDGLGIDGSRPRIPLIGRDKRKGKQHEEDECGDREEALTASGPPGGGISKAEEDEERCAYECDEEMVREMRKAGRDVDRYCMQRRWYTVYRIMPLRPGTEFADYDQVEYVGITSDYSRRTCQHTGPRGKFPIDRYEAECLVDVPYYGVARAIEQALIDMYGLSNKKNVNLDVPERTGVNPPGVGAFSRWPPTLRNKINSVTPAVKPLYCAMRVFGQEFLRLRAPFVTKGNANRRWDANFPRRDCSKWWELKHHADAS
jgi:hypothetical protein